MILVGSSSHLISITLYHHLSVFSGYFPVILQEQESVYQTTLVDIFNIKKGWRYLTAVTDGACSE